MKKFTFLSVALLLAASQAMAQFSTSPLVPQLKQESTGLNIAAKAPTKVKAQVPEAPISDRPAGKFYEVFGGFHYVASNNGMPYISSFSNRPSEIVEGTDGYVYIKNNACRYRRWVHQRPSSSSPYYKYAHAFPRLRSCSRCRTTAYWDQPRGRTGKPWQ